VVLTMKKSFKKSSTKLNDDPLTEDLTGYLSQLKWRKTLFSLKTEDAKGKNRNPKITFQKRSSVKKRPF
jgi:hypothetical protein